MEQTHYGDVSELLRPLSDLNCDARVSLLLAAAFEAGGEAPEATDVLQRAHSAWPSNNSIAASLAREYLAAKEVDKAAKALAHFHASAETPEQEMEMAVVVYLAAHQLVPAQAVAEAAYKYDPSVHTLLLLANALQLQGRYPDVIKLLENKRAVYTDSPEFFITLAESEFDASIYPAAREDLQHAIALDAKSYQAHYILGNVLFKLSDTEGAIAEYRQAIDLAPDQPRTYFQLALVLRSKEDEAGEKQVLEQTLAADDHYAPAQCELGRILLEEHRAADAVSHLNAAIQYNPRSEEAYFLLAKAYAGLGEKDKSREMVKRLEIVRKENRPVTENGNGGDPAANQTPLP
jgi:tetratricopeptide (TPR) repeat protein